MEKKDLTFLTIVKCWDNPEATKDASKRTRMLVDYIYTDKQAALLDYYSAINHYPTFGWSVDYRVATKTNQIAFSL